MTRGLTSAGAMTHIGVHRGHGGRRGVGTGAGRGPATGTQGIGTPVIGTRGTTRRMARRTTGAITVPAQAARIALHTAQALQATAVPDIPAATIARRPTPAATIVPEIWAVRPTTAITEARTVRPLPPETALIRMIITARRTIAVADVTTITAELAATTATITVPTAITTGATQEAPIAVAAEAVAVVVLTVAVAAPAAGEAVNILISSIERFSTIFLL